MYKNKFICKLYYEFLTELAIIGVAAYPQLYREDSKSQKE